MITDAKDFNKQLQIDNYLLEVYDPSILEEQIIWHLKIHNNHHKVDTQIVIPNQDTNGIIWYQGIPYVIVNVALAPEKFDISKSNIDELLFMSGKDILILVIKSAIEQSLNHLDNTEHFRELVQNRIDAFFKGKFVDPKTGKNWSKYLHWVNADRKYEVLSALQTVYLEYRTNDLAVDQRKPNDTFNCKLDLSTTPTSDMVGVAYRMTDGAYIQDGKIIEGELMAVTSKLALFHENTKPSRHILDRTSFEQNSILLQHEKPLVENDLIECDLYGNNALVAFGYDGYNHLDAITVSRSFANKFRSVQYYYQRFSSDTLPDILCKVGDSIKGNQPLAITTIGSDIVPVSVRDLPNTGKIVEIKLFDGVEHNTHVCFVRVKYEVEYELTYGCKLTTRHATKGVVGHIIDDDKMPLIDINGHQERVEVLINPYSIKKRGAMGFIREMGYGLIAHVTKNTMKAISFGDFNLNKFYNLLSACHLPLSMRFTSNTNQQIMAGYVFFIRVDKHDKEAINWQNEDIYTNQYGLAIDGYGQMWNTTLHQLATSKGLVETSLSFLKQNRTGDTRLFELMAAYGYILSNNNQIGELSIVAQSEQFNKEASKSQIDDVKQLFQQKETTMSETSQTAVNVAQSYVKMGMFNLSVGSKPFITGVQKDQMPTLEQEWYQKCADVASEVVAQYILAQNEKAPSVDKRFFVKGPENTKNGHKMYTVTMPIVARGVGFNMTMTVFDRTVTTNNCVLNFA